MNHAIPSNSRIDNNSTGKDASIMLSQKGASPEERVELYLRARVGLQKLQSETDLQTMMGKLCHPSRK
jgi:hypothetical protein